MTRYPIIWLLLLLYPFTTFGQDTMSCPTNVILAMSRANTACNDFDRNRLCYGNGNILVDADTAMDAFSQQGDIVPIESINSISLQGETDDYNIARMTLQANLLNLQAGREVTMLMFGDVQVINHVDVLPQVTLIATGLLNIRKTTETDGEIILALPLRSNLTVIGVAEEGGWYRVIVPNTDELGWVNQSLVNVEGDASQLQVVDETTPLLRPFQLMTIATTPDDAPCDGTPDSGILIQTPNTGSAPVNMTINGATFKILGTILIQANSDAMKVFVLNGQVEVSGELAPEGSVLSIPLDGDLQVNESPTSSVPYEMNSLIGVPVNNLSYRINIAPPTTLDAIEQFKRQAVTIPTPTPSRQEQLLQSCRHRVNKVTTAWAGPGTFYEVIRTYEIDDIIRPVIRTEVDGVTWYLLRQGGWINASVVTASDTCGEIPLSDVVEYPAYNTLELETCESTNGPIRDGQWLTITFYDGGWETLREAQRATQVDPGRVTVDTTSLSVYAGEPIVVGPNKYFRIFNARWEAKSGTYRVIGQRLSYILSCDITVPT